MKYIHKYEIWLEHGGPEEGGWNYTQGRPENPEGYLAAVPQLHELNTDPDKSAYEVCRALNEAEHERRKKEEKYEYTSVLSYECNYYCYTVEDTALPSEYPIRRPHYE